MGIDNGFVGAVSGTISCAASWEGSILGPFDGKLLLSIILLYHNYAIEVSDRLGGLLF